VNDEKKFEGREEFFSNEKLLFKEGEGNHA